MDRCPSITSNSSFIQKFKQRRSSGTPSTSPVAPPPGFERVVPTPIDSFLFETYKPNYPYMTAPCYHIPVSTFSVLHHIDMSPTAPSTVQMTPPDSLLSSTPEAVTPPQTQQKGHSAPELEDDIEQQLWLEIQQMKRETEQKSFKASPAQRKMPSRQKDTRQAFLRAYRHIPCNPEAAFTGAPVYRSGMAPEFRGFY